MSDETKPTELSVENGLTDISGGISFDTQKFAFGQRIGLKTNSTDTSVLEKAIEALTIIPGDLLSILDTLFGGKDGGSKSPIFGYDPSAKWLAGLAITYGVLTLDVLLVDGQFYGLLIKIDKKKKKKNGDKKSFASSAIVLADEDKEDDNKKDDEPFAGLQLEIIYRKINDHLGEFSADLTLPKKFRELKMGTATITLPAVGIAIWTNGDFKVSIGWPLGKRSFNIAFPPSPIPWAGGGGLYFAKLRSEDNPGKLGTNFNPIIEFGIGIRIGAATKGNWGILEYAASLYLFGTFQGFLAWEEGHSFSDGLDYYWFCASVGITGHLEGSVDFVVLKVTVSLDVTASVTLALETKHAAYAIAEFKAEVEAKIKILFITIHFSFSIDLKKDITFGSGDPAKITGPTPPAPKLLSAFETEAVLVGETSSEELYGTGRELAAAPAPTPISVPLHFLLQPTIRFDASSNNWLPAGVASLVVDRTPPANGNKKLLGLGNDKFSQLVASLAAYLLKTYGNYSDPQSTVTAANLQALCVALYGAEHCGQTNPPPEASAPGAGLFNLQAVYDWLSQSQITFTVSGVTTGAGSNTDGALFPMIPGLILTYNHQSTNFGDSTPPAEYLKVLDEYFAKLSLIGDGKIDESAHQSFLAAAEQPTSASWFPGVVFADYFGILAKQIYRELADLKTGGTLDADLANIDIGNLAGIATRFLQHGLRLPDPSDTSAPLDEMPERGLFELTAQQFDIELDDKKQPILSATLSGQAKVQVTIAEGSGTAQLPFALFHAPQQSPLWSPQPLERIKNVPLTFLLRQGVKWAEQVSDKQTKQWQLFRFPDTLQSELREQTNLTLKLSATDGSDPAHAKPASGLTGLMIGFSLALVPQLTPPGTYLGSIFQVFGTDDDTRDLMELLFASGALNNAEVNLLLPAGAPNSGLGYKTSTADNTSTLLLKTNLSTYNQPNLMALFAEAEALDALRVRPDLPPLGPTASAISNPTDFLRLLWECSVVHSGGYYLYVPDLKPADFGAQQRLEVALVVKPKSAAPTPAVAVTNYNNVILVDASSLAVNDRVQAGVYLTNGAPVTEPKPNYPAGTLAFGAIWNNAPSDVIASDAAAYATTLYQLLQFRLAAGNNIEDSGWSMPLGPDGDANTWTYKRAVPVYRFLQNAPETPNRYGAIGITATLNLQLDDVFGNAFGLRPLQLAAVYNDQLISLDEWPGASTVFAFNAGTSGNATLDLTLSFQPDQVTEPKTAIPFYQTIYDQLTDPRTSVSVTSALSAEAVQLKTTSGDDTQTALAKFVAAIIAYLSAGGQRTAPTAIDLTGSVQTNYVSQINEDLFPLWVSLTISRTAPKEMSAAPGETLPYNYPPGFLSVTTQLPPLLNTTDSTNPAALRQWTLGFEKAFANFDGSNGLLKVMVGSPPSKVLATASKLGVSAAGAVNSTPGDLWALKWGKANGVEVSFGNTATHPQPAQQPVYFAPLPLSTELVSGTVPISTYDVSSGNQTGSAQTTFSGIDLDEMARSFLQSVDGLLTPELSTAIAQLDGGKYHQLMVAKEELAYAISASISWVFKDQMPTSEGAPGMGDIKSAQVRFRENLLASLGSDFATSVIIQLPATVSVKNQFESGAASRPPDLFGNPTPSPATSKTTLNQYTISTAALPVKNGTGYLNFLLEAINPTTHSDLCLQFAYDIGFLDHQFETSEEQFGYTPSSWLRFVVPDTDPVGSSPVLDVPLGQLDIPIPLRAYPTPPRLVRQAARATIPDPTTIKDALQATYELTVARPRVAQDSLHLLIEFNSAKVAGNSMLGAASPLFSALANFQFFQSQYLTIVTDAILKKAPSAGQWLSDIVLLIQAVADAWQAEQEVSSALESAQDVPQYPLPFTWEYILQVPDETDPSVMTLTWNGEDVPVWPTIETAKPQSTKNPNTMRYKLSSDANLDEPTISWPGLSVITNQNISATAQIVRNETLAGCGGEAQSRPTNPDFVYSTGSVTFVSAVIPLLETTGTITIQANSVDDAVNQLVTQLMQPTNPLSQVGLGLQVEYSFVLVSGRAGQLQTKLPVFLARTDVTTASAPAPGVETPQQLINALAAALKSWYGDFHPSDTNASLLFAVTIFAANSQQSLARMLDIESPISGPGWWS